MLKLPHSAAVGEPGRVGGRRAQRSDDPPGDAPCGTQPQDSEPARVGSSHWATLDCRRTVARNLIRSGSPQRLSNIIKTFNDQFGSIPWTDGDRVHKLITEEIPNRVAADKAYQNAKKNSDKQNARIEHDKALGRVMTAVLKDDTQLFKQFSDNEGFRRWLTDTVFALTYQHPESQ